MATKQTDRERWNALQAEYRAARNAKATKEIEVRVRYGDPISAAWRSRARTSEVNAIDRLDARVNRIGDKLFALLDRMQTPRSWGTGVPYGYVCEELTYDDAITRGALSVVPRPAFGHTVQAMRRFAEPLTDTEKIRVCQ